MCSDPGLHLVCVEFFKMLTYNEKITQRFFNHIFFFMKSVSDPVTTTLLKLSISAKEINFMKTHTRNRYLFQKTALKDPFFFRRSSLTILRIMVSKKRMGPWRKRGSQQLFFNLWTHFSSGLARCFREMIFFALIRATERPITDPYCHRQKKYVT